MCKIFVRKPTFYELFLIPNWGSSLTLKATGLCHMDVLEPRCLWRKQISLFDSYISNDYLGMSQRKETIEAGINALMKYGTGACAAQPIGGYLDIHRQLEKMLTLSVKKMQFYSLLDLEQMPACFVRYLARMTLPILILISILARWVDWLEQTPSA